MRYTYKEKHKETKEENFHSKKAKPPIRKWPNPKARKEKFSSTSEEVPPGREEEGRKEEDDTVPSSQGTVDSQSDEKMDIDETGNIANARTPKANGGKEGEQEAQSPEKSPRGQNIKKSPIPSDEELHD